MQLKKQCEEKRLSLIKNILAFLVVQLGTFSKQPYFLGGCLRNSNSADFIVFIYFWFKGEGAHDLLSYFQAPVTSKV